MIVSGGQQRDPAIDAHVSVLPQTPLPSRLPHNIKQISLCYTVKGSVNHSVVSDSLQPSGLWPSRLLCPWDSLGKNIEVGCHFLVQGIVPTQGSNQCLLPWLVDSLLLSPLGGPISIITSLFPNYMYCEAEFPSHLATKTI